MANTRRSFLTALASLAAVPALAAAPGMSLRTAYAFSFPALEGGEIALAAFTGKPMLIVNTASLCAYTPQYRGLQALFTRYAAEGLTVIGVPCNDFGAQEPGGAEQIRETVAMHRVTFPMTAKTVARGPGAHGFYRWAAAERPRDAPSWNFHKYLLGRDGRIAAVFPTAIEPMDASLVAAVERELTRE